MSLVESKSMMRFNHLYVRDVFHHFNLIHPHKLSAHTYVPLSYDLIPFAKVKNDEHMMEYCCNFVAFENNPQYHESKYSLSDKILSKKIRKNLEKESFERKLISNQTKSDVKIMDSIRENFEHHKFYTNIKDDEWIEEINKFFVCAAYTQIMFSEMKQFFEQKLLELTEHKWIIKYDNNRNIFSNKIIYYVKKFGQNSVILITHKNGIECKSNVKQVNVIHNSIKFEDFSSNLIELASKTVLSGRRVDQSGDILRNALNKKFASQLNGQNFYCFVTKHVIFDYEYVCKNIDVCLIHLNEYSIYVVLGKHIERIIFLKNIPTKLNNIWAKITPQDKKVIEHVVSCELRVLSNSVFYDVFTHKSVSHYFNRNVSKNNECIYSINYKILATTDLEKHVYKLNEFDVLTIYY